jgi:hypothetical protein
MPIQPIGKLEYIAFSKLKCAAKKERMMKAKKIMSRRTLWPLLEKRDIVVLLLVTVILTC